MFCAENEKVTFYPRQTPVLYYGGTTGVVSGEQGAFRQLI